jgi:Tfp pilus assembly protein FimT
MSVKHCKRPLPKRQGDARGFTILEVVVVMAIAIITAAMAIPGYTSINRYLRIAGDARDINGAVALAKMRAAQDFTHARVYVDLAANTFHVERWDRTAGCWKTDLDSVIRCTDYAASPVQRLSLGVTFGVGTAGAPPTNTQSAIGQAPACGTGAAVSGTAYSATGNTACIEFNSRGTQVNPSTLTADNTNALYITDGNSVFGVTVNAGGLLQDWTLPHSSTAWSLR